MSLPALTRASPGALLGFVLLCPLLISISINLVGVCLASAFSLWVQSAANRDCSVSLGLALRAWKEFWTFIFWIVERLSLLESIDT